MYSKFWKNTGGNFALITAIVAPLLMGVGGVTVDYFMYYRQVDALQNAADAAALASVKEMSLAGTTQAKSAQTQDIAKSYVYAAFYGNSDEADSKAELLVTSTPDPKKGEIKVEIAYTWAPIFAQLFDNRVTPIKVASSAKMAGDSLTCIIGLMQPEKFAQSSLHLDNDSRILAEGCSVYSNSVSRFGLRADGNAEMTAQSICSAGGIMQLRDNSFKPAPITDCPKIEDPLQDRATPVHGGCNHDNLIVTDNTDLKPGVYCNGLTISGSAKVTLQNGLYVIKDGPFTVTDNASLEGKAVSFFLTGEKSTFDFQKDTTIDLAAMESGSLAGLLFYEDRNVPYSFDFNPFFMSTLPEDVRIHKISSNNARNLLGTIYLSRSILLVNADAPVADASAYTAIITGRLWLQAGPTLTLNADYTKTKVPVPNGLMGTEPILIK